MNASRVSAQKPQPAEPRGGTALPYPDQSFDRACAINCFQFFPDPDLAELHRVLRPGGRLLTCASIAAERN